MDNHPRNGPHGLEGGILKSEKGRPQGWPSQTLDEGVGRDRGRRFLHLQEDAIKHRNGGDGQTQEKDQREKEIHHGGSKGVGGRGTDGEEGKLVGERGHLRHKRLTPSLSILSIQDSWPLAPSLLSQDPGVPSPFPPSDPGVGSLRPKSWDTLDPSSHIQEPVLQTPLLSGSSIPGL